MWDGADFGERVRCSCISVEAPEIGPFHFLVVSSGDSLKKTMQFSGGGHLECCD